MASRRPLGIAAAGMIAGIVAARVWLTGRHAAFFIIAGFGVLGLLLVLSRCRGRGVSGVIFFLFLLLGAARFICAGMPAATDLSWLIREREEVLLLGEVTGIPSTVHNMFGRTEGRFRVTARRLCRRDGREYRVSGVVDVCADPARTRAVRHGDSVLMRGRIGPYGRDSSAPPRYRMRISPKQFFDVQERSRRFDVRTLAAALHERCRRVIMTYMPTENGFLLARMIIGLREPLSARNKELFSRTGTAHIFAISGLHVGLVVFLIMGILSSLVPFRRLRYLAAIGGIVLYACMTGACAPVVRASIMAVLLIGGYLIEREPDPYNSLGAAALVLVFLDPQNVFSVSFQLSFVSVLSIIVLVPRLERLFLPREAFSSRALYRSVRFLCGAGAVSLSAWLGILPLIAHYFHLVTPVSLLANMLIVPSAFFVIAGGFLLLGAAAVSPFLAALVAQMVHLLLNMICAVAAYFASLPGASFPVKDFGAGAIAGYYLVYAMIIFFIFPRTEKEISEVP